MKIRAFAGFSPGQERDDVLLDKLLNDHFAPFRNTDPDTNGQWLRLQRALTGDEGRVRAPKPRLAPRLAFAAFIVALVLIGTYMYFNTSPGGSVQTFATGKGEQKEITLSDGTQVTLSYATELTVDEFRKSNPRHVRLSGESYFHVRRNETPFIVSTRYGDIQVLGTRFDVRARDGELIVGVDTGVVRISVMNHGRDSALLLSRHQMGRCLPDDFPHRMEDISSPEYPGWLHGKLFLDKTQVQEACREIEMRFNVVVLLDDQDTRRRLISGVLNAATANSAMIALCELTGKRFSRDGQMYHIH